jgi:hypothetical protein
MKIQFLHQVLIGTHVYAEGEVVDAPDGIAAYAMVHKHAVEYVEPTPAPKPAVREATSAAPAQARKATSR